MFLWANFHQPKAHPKLGLAVCLVSGPERIAQQSMLIILIATRLLTGCVRW